MPLHIEIKELASLLETAIDDSGVDFFLMAELDWERFCKKEKKHKYEAFKRASMNISSIRNRHIFLPPH